MPSNKCLWQAERAKSLHRDLVLLEGYIMDGKTREAIIQIMEFSKQLTQLNDAHYFTNDQNREYQKELKEIADILRRGDDKWKMEAQDKLEYLETQIVWEALDKLVECECDSVVESKKELPTRDDASIDTWEERDRMSIVVTDKRNDKVIWEVWDDNAREMFEDGILKGGIISMQLGTSKPDNKLEESIYHHLEEMGLLAKEK